MQRVLTVYFTVLCDSGRVSAEQVGQEERGLGGQRK